jgi:hypothetical protein
MESEHNKKEHKYYMICNEENKTIIQQQML